ADLRTHLAHLLGVEPAALSASRATYDLRRLRPARPHRTHPEHPPLPGNRHRPAPRHVPHPGPRPAHQNRHRPPHRPRSTNTHTTTRRHPRIRHRAEPTHPTRWTGSLNPLPRQRIPPPVTQT